MGFPQKIKIDALTLAARHCCVCHRYKGLKIEVHHIEQEGKGGANSLENAIALCFDCHADAGHYNDWHPKGTKFSKPELIKARDEWYKIVKEHTIQAPANTSEHLHFRHMILRDYHVAKEIFSGDLKHFPFQDTLLIQNDILEFINKLIEANTQQWNVTSVQYSYHDSDEEIFQKYPDAEIVDKSKMDYPYFKVIRVPKIEEVQSIKDQLDPFIKLLLENNIDAKHFSRSVIYENASCGSDEFENRKYIENLIFRSLWYSFLTITNTSNVPVELHSLVGSSQNSEKLLVNVLDKSFEAADSLFFPKVAIQPNQTVIVPCGLILVPFENEPFNETTVFESEMDEEAKSHSITHFIRNQNKTDYSFLGKYFRPSSITYNADDRVNHSEMHELDMNNLFVFDRCWHMGCCPHLFFLRKDEKYEYVRELFTQTPAVEMVETIVIPQNIKRVSIAELEDEVTYISKILINAETKYSNIILEKGQTFEFAVNQNDLITLIGYYKSAVADVSSSAKIILRNHIIGQFLGKTNLR